MTKAIWCQENDRICLRLPTGEVVQPTAMEVFRAVFGRANEQQGVPYSAHPSDDLPGISFSREPAQATLRVRSVDNHIIAELGVTTDTGFAPLATDTDQLVVDARWYPVHTSALVTTVEWAIALGIHLGRDLTVGSLVALRMSRDRPCLLIDEVVATSATIAAGTAKLLGEISGLTGQLYEYQSDGVAFLRLVSEQGVGCVLGDEMGLGKTLQVIALLQLEKNACRGPSLVVAPATLLENWRRELAQFAPQLTVLLHAGSDRAGIASRLGRHDVTLVSYETTIRDETLLYGIQWNVVALDEAQNIKNPEAQRTLAVKRLRRRVSVAVTGTPLENRLDDLWSIADFALPGLLGDLKAFRAEFSDAADATRLAPIVAPLLLRRMVSEVAKDLPEKIEIPQALQMSRHLAEAYEALRKTTLAEYGPAGGLVATTRLRMLCAHPSLLSSWSDDPAFEMPKYLRTLEILEEVFSRREKALVFSTYQDIADILMSDVPRRFKTGIFRCIDGRVPVEKRQTIVDEFFAFDGYGAMFLNPKAAGSGLNITAANHVIHYNPEWNPAMTAQASARAFRRKQTRPVTIHHLFFVDTVEEVVRDTSLFKQTLAGQAVTGHAGDVDPLVIARALQISPLATTYGLDS